MSKTTMYKDFLNIEVPFGTRIAFVGDVHEHPEQFQKMLKEIKPSRRMWFVSVGDFYDKGFGMKTAEAMTTEMRSLQDRGIGFAVRGSRGGSAGSSSLCQWRLVPDWHCYADRNPAGHRDRLVVLCDGEALNALRAGGHRLPA